MRTYLGTSLAADIIKDMPAPLNEKEYKAAVRSVAAAVSKRLGNTPTVALQSYIAPACFTGWRQSIGD